MDLYWEHGTEDKHDSFNMQAKLMGFKKKLIQNKENKMLSAKAFNHFIARVRKNIRCIRGFERNGF